MAWQNQYHASFFSFLPQIAVKKYLTVHFTILSVSLTGIFAMCMHTRLYCKMMSVWYEELGKPDIREIGFWEERGEHRNLTLVWFLFMRSYSGCRLRHGLLGWKVVNLGVELITITVASRGLEGDSYRSHYRVAECNDRFPLRRLKLLNPLPPKHLSICEGYLRLQSGLRGTFLSPPSKSGITRRPHTLTGIHLPIQGPPPWLRSELSSWRRSTTIRPIDLPLSVSTPLRLQLQMIGGNWI